MIESLATIMSHFPGETNRARCLAHIVNLVAKIILRQFDMSKEKKKIPPDIDAEDKDKDDGDQDEDLDEKEERVLDKEEKEMDDADEDDDEDAEALARDLEIIEKVMEEEIERATKKGKPVHQVLFKVGS